jgi:hypothetical protein
MKRQIHVLIGTASLFLLSSLLHGQLLVENFDYSAGDELKNHGWTQIRSGTNPFTISSPGLEYSGYAQSSIGNAVFLPKASEEVMKNFTEQTSGSVYVSLLVQVSDASTAAAGYTFLYLGPQNTGIFNRYLSLYVRKNQSNQISFGIHKGSGIVYCTDYVYALNTTYLIVARYQFNTGSSDDDILHLWINPPTDSTESTADQINPEGNDAPNLGEIVLSQNQEEPALYIDGLNVSTTWPLAYTSVSAPDISSPEAFRLSQNYPNPFNSGTCISYAVSEPADVAILVIDCSGREIRTLVEGHHAAGKYSVRFEANGIPSGIYYYRMRIGNVFTETRKILILK